MIRRAFTPSRRIGRSFKSTTWTTTIVQRGALAFPMKRRSSGIRPICLSCFIGPPVSNPHQREGSRLVKQHLHLIDNAVRGSGEVRDLVFKLLRQQKGSMTCCFSARYWIPGQTFPSLTRFDAMSSGLLPPVHRGRAFAPDDQKPGGSLPRQEAA